MKQTYESYVKQRKNKFERKNKTKVPRTNFYFKEEEEWKKIEKIKIDRKNKTV